MKFNKLNIATITYHLKSFVNSNHILFQIFSISQNIVFERYFSMVNFKVTVLLMDCNAYISFSAFFFN